jgi:ribosomal-protein-alanine N-acetyltransferase
MPPTIETDRLLLRPFTLDDAEALHSAIFSDPDVMEFMPGGIPRAVKQTERVIEYYIDHWQQRDYGVWAVVHKEDDKLIGQAGLNFIDEISQTEVLYAFAKPYWAQGLATEAARASCRYAYRSDIGITKVIALVHPDNTYSKKVIDKLGMEYRREVKLWRMKLLMYVSTALTFQSGGASTFILHA